MLTFWPGSDGDQRIRLRKFRGRKIMSGAGRSASLKFQTATKEVLKNLFISQSFKYTTQKIVGILEIALVGFINQCFKRKHTVPLITSCETVLFTRYIFNTV